MALTFQTDTIVSLTIGETTYEGREWRWDYTSIKPWSGDNSAEANTFHSINSEREWTCDAFLGIEYARADRWKPPILYNPGNVTLHANSFVRVPPQESAAEGNDAGRPATGIDDGAYDWDGLGVTEGEDCLRLAIWRPKGTAPAGGWPCLVYFHGGANYVNSYCNYQAWGNWLAAMGIVVINVEYRLGLFGYFWHSDLEAEVDYAGPHFAHMDRLKALEWINTYASDLNINTSKICLYGSSAGGQAITYILADPSANGTYTSAWASSGGGGSPDVKKNPNWQRKGFKHYADIVENSIKAVGDQIGMSGISYNATAAANNWITALRDTPTNWVTFQHTMGFSGLNMFPWVREEDFPYSSNYVRALNGVFNNVPVIFSYSGNEANVIGTGEQGDSVSGSATIRCRNVGENFANMVRSSPWNAWDINEQERMVYIYSIYGVSAYAMAYALADLGQDTWSVLWNHVSQGNNSNDGAGHSSNVAYTFMHPSWQTSMTAGGEAKLYELDIRVAYKMAVAIINFAANGDPNIPYDDLIDLGLWETPLSAWSFTKFNTTNKPMNSIGSESRWASTGGGSDDTLYVTNGLYGGILEPFRMGLKSY